MKASVGRTIIVMGGVAESNGVDRAPGVINRVWADNAETHGRDTLNGRVLINATAFPDCAAPVNVTSIHLYDTEDEAVRSGDPVVAFWPPRE